MKWGLKLLIRNYKLGMKTIHWNSANEERNMVQKNLLGT